MRRSFIAGSAGLALGGVAGCGEADVGSRPAPTGAPTTSLVATTPATSATALPTSAPTSTGMNTGESDYFPPDGTDWETVTPVDAGFTESGIAEVVALVEAARSTTFALLVGGRLVTENYFRGTDQSTVRDVASVQKSVTSTLVGLARDRGLLTLDDPVDRFLDEGWSNAPPAHEAAITVRHLMTHSSGLTEQLTSAQEPGTTFFYNTVAYQRLRLVLEAASGLDINTISRSWLFDGIGLGSTARWVPRVDGEESGLWGLELTARDMARFGLFAMRNGHWGADQITDPGWFAEAWTPCAVKPDYGLLWWLMGLGPIGRRGAPEDWVAALGARDQKIYVVPSAELVVTRQGDRAGEVSETTSDFDRALAAAVARARI